MARSESQKSLAANLLLLAASLPMTFVLLAIVEGAVRLTGLGAEEPGASRLKYQQVIPPILEAATTADGARVLRPADTRLPYQSILQEKPTNGLRVFTFGGSATAGLGFSPNVTFAHHLERLLERAYPDRSVEVMNLGIVALSSKQVQVLIADACRNYDADLVVVYSGNNEFLEIHAKKFFAASQGLLGRAMDLARQSHLYRFVDRAIRGSPQRLTVAEQDFSSDDLRLTQNTIIQEIDMTPGEIADVVSQYETNLDAMVRVALATDTPIILMTVASNWKWRGRSDLPEDWIDELLGSQAPGGPDRYRQARTALDGKLADDSSPERSEWLFRRAVAAEALGDFDAAREDYRAAMNADPHLRRSLDEMNDRVRAVAERHGVPVLDTVEVLSREATNGIVGFDEFYDYVHFTPRGVILVAAALFDAMLEMGVIEPAQSPDPAVYARNQTERLAGLDHDPLEVDEWMGFSFDPAMIRDRDLWKYDRMVRELDTRLEADPADVTALVYRGNANFFRIDGGPDAASDYRAALDLNADHPEAKANLELLEREGRL